MTMTFESLDLVPEILKALKEEGYSKPSPIQLKGIPEVMNGRDVMAAAQTGTGKTASFTLPILQKLHLENKPIKKKQARVLILTPTRELAAQIDQNIEKYSKYLSITSFVVFGGVKTNPQIQRLKTGVDILVATPGRLLDLYQQKAIGFDELNTLVLDEADRMLDMGFIKDMKRIMSFLPKNRQNLLFSATFSDAIDQLVSGMIKDPVKISVTPKNSTAEKVEQSLFSVDKKQKASLLAHLYHSRKWQQVLVFCKTKHGANKLVKQLDQKKISAMAIHGNKSQSARTKALAAFKSKEIGVLVATDIAARGLDIEQLPQVVNFDLPNVPEDYVHRIGRTGRASFSGKAISLVSHDEAGLLSDIENLIKQRIDREVVDGFEPLNALVETNLNKKNTKARRVGKQNKQNQRSERAKAFASKRTDKYFEEKNGSNNTGNKQNNSKKKRKPIKSKTASENKHKTWEKDKRQSKKDSKNSSFNPWGQK